LHQQKSNARATRSKVEFEVDFHHKQQNAGVPSFRESRIGVRI
jgi:hypothetical protein